MSILGSTEELGLVHHMNGTLRVVRERMYLNGAVSKAAVGSPLEREAAHSPLP
jgi:hypothetical protein